MQFSIPAPGKPAPLNALELTGRTRTHIVQYETPRVAAHAQALAALLALREAAARDGIDIAVFSAFRDFDAQVKIWNAKFRGRRVLYDRHGRALDYATLDKSARVAAILNWSALPGASRHHWGSDIDVYDRAAMPPDYRVRLLPEEYARDGVFARLAAWLDTHAHAFGFYRPYAEDRGGVCPEPWHLSYAPVSIPALEALTVDLLDAALGESKILGKRIVRAQLREIHARYVANVCPPATGVLRATR
jgi:LAS superfamily LD-carboxypeptidase LdcB